MRNSILIVLLFCGIVLLYLITETVSEAQVGVFSKNNLIEYTALYEGERFPDGRPKVSDNIIERMKNVSVEEAWTVCRNYGFNNQFDGNWVITQERPVLVGRAFTAYYMPKRPDVDNIIKNKGANEGKIINQNLQSWIIDPLVKGDVVAIDLFGKVTWGTFAGDNLSSAIKTKSGNGFIIDGGARDLYGVLDIPDFPVFTRGWDPTFLDEVMLMGINTPIRIGQVTVMPGDIVLGTKEGILFVPAHLAVEVVEMSEVEDLMDQFRQQRLREEKYSSGEIEGVWTNKTIVDDFEKWWKAKGDKIPEGVRKRLLKD